MWGCYLFTKGYQRFQIYKHVKCMNNNLLRMWIDVVVETVEGEVEYVPDLSTTFANVFEINHFNIL